MDRVAQARIRQLEFDLHRTKELLRRAEASLSDAAHRTAELERSNVELEEFAAIASHDLQEPLRVIASYAELLSERYRGRIDETADKYLRHAIDGAKRMQLLLGSLLAHSHAAAGIEPLVPVSSQVALDRALQSTKIAIEAAGACIERAALPVVMADELALERVFQNLISNAVRFRSEAPPRIRIGADRLGDYFRLFVEDNGLGIEPGDAERVFRPFQRVHGRARGDGCGMGLAIVKRIVERHGGRVWFESAPQAGTTFFFTLQAALAETT